MFATRTSREKSGRRRNKKEIEKLKELKEQIELKNRKISELNEANRQLKELQNDEISKFEKKYEILRLKLEMETKMRNDVSELKKRLEKELEDAGKTFI